MWIARLARVLARWGGEAIGARGVRAWVEGMRAWVEGMRFSPFLEGIGSLSMK